MHIYIYIYIYILPPGAQPTVTYPVSGRLTYASIFCLRARSLLLVAIISSSYY